MFSILLPIVLQCQQFCFIHIMADLVVGGAKYGGVDYVNGVVSGKFFGPNPHSLRDVGHPSVNCWHNFDMRLLPDIDRGVFLL